ncbi:MAG: hypothetical protein ACJ8C4_16485 [Gemmataceae bacterium]
MTDPYFDPYVLPELKKGTKSELRRRLIVPAGTRLLAGFIRGRLDQPITELDISQLNSSDAAKFVETSLDQFESSITDFQARTSRDLQVFLECLAGRTFEHEVNKSIVATIQSIVRRLEIAIQCPTCNEPGRLRTKKPARTKGVIVIEHPQARGKNTTHSIGPPFPKLNLLWRVDRIQTPPENPQILEN